MSTLGDPLPPPLSTFVNFWRPPPPAPWVDVNKVRSLTSKILSRIVHRRISETLDSHLRQEQACFRPGRSCSEHIFTLRQILEQSHEWNSSLYINFLDFKKAFDSVHRDSLWKILLHYGTWQALLQHYS